LTGSWSHRASADMTITCLHAGIIIARGWSTLVKDGLTSRQQK
jgi:hypothetical protein